MIRTTPFSKPTNGRAVLRFKTMLNGSFAPVMTAGLCPAMEEKMEYTIKGRLSFTDYKDFLLASLIYL